LQTIKFGFAPTPVQRFLSTSDHSNDLFFIDKKPSGIDLQSERNDQCDVIINSSTTESDLDEASLLDVGGDETEETLFFIGQYLVCCVTTSRFV